MRKRISILLILIFLGAPFLVLADFASSTNFQIERGIIDLGGTQATSSGFNLRTSIGAPGLGISSSTTFTIRGGFLNFFVPTPAPAPAPAPSPSPSPAPSPGGGGGGGGGGTGYLFPSKPIPLIPYLPSGCSVDLNKDNHVDIVDLSIMLFYYGASGTSLGCFDLNGNGVVDFPDISIIMYYWTG